MAALYTCGTCRVKFADLELMQSHYKCDWHRYNLKRKVAELPPVSAENFAEILKTYQKDVPKDSKGDGANQEIETDRFYCKSCSKSFQNAGSFASHMESKKHLERVKNQSESDEGKPKGTVAKSAEKPEDESSSKPEEDAQMNDEDDWEDEDDLPPYDVTLCLFCPKVSDSLEASVAHMSENHSFFVPDFDYCADLNGLVDYLGKKITDGHLCLYCNQHFHDTLAAQRHMASKGHTKMGYENDFLLEYEEFYDFSLGEESADDKDSESQILDGSGYEMTLPSGITVGHRDLNRYYKQHLKPVQDVALRTNVAKHYKALGWKDTERGSGYAQEMIKQINRLRQEHQKKNLSVGMRKNQIQMKHYRRQYGF